MNIDIIQNVILPVLIIVARIIDVSLGTLRIILISKGYKKYAPIIGFVEVFIWILIARQVFTLPTNFFSYIGYALGFALGNYFGFYIEERLALGYVVVKIITHLNCETLIEELKKNGFGLTHFSAYGANGKVEVIYTTINRTYLPKIEKIIKEFNPYLFYTIEDLKYVSKYGGVFPHSKRK